MTVRRLDARNQRKRFQELYGRRICLLPHRPSYKQKVQARLGSAPDKDDPGRAEAKRIRAWLNGLRPWIDSRRLSEGQAEAIHDLVLALEAIAKRLEAGDTELPIALTKKHLVALRDVARAFGAELRRDGDRRARPQAGRIQRGCPPGIYQAVSEWVLTRRSLGSKDVLRSVRRGLETGVRRGYTDEEFDVLKRIGDATREQIIQRGPAIVARRLRVPTDRIVFINGRFFGGGLSPRDEGTLEWVRSQIKTIHWGKIQRYVRDTYPAGKAPLGRLLTGSVENFTKWIVRNGDGLLADLPAKGGI
jgi:hypothetical protein